MKKLLIMALVTFACCTHAADKTEPPKPQDPKYINVTDSENKIVAEVERATGKVKYYQSAEKAFEALFAVHMNLVSKVDEFNKAAQKKAEDEAKKASVKKK